MDPWELARAADEISQLVSVTTAEQLLVALDGATEAAAVRAALRRHAPGEVQRLLAALIDEVGMGIACAAVAAAVATRSRIEAESEQIEMVWTGPTTLSLPSHRSTAAVVHELIASARVSLTVATFSASDIDDFLDALDKRRREGIKIRLLLETPRSDGQGPDGPKAFARLVPYVKALEWPRKARRNADWTSMHVKLVIKDTDAVLVTSANMSGPAMRDNMEMGVLLRGGTIAQLLSQHFDQLEDAGIVQPLVGK